MRAFLDANPRYALAAPQGAAHVRGHRPPISSHEVAPLIKLTAAQRTAKSLGDFATRVKKVAMGTPAAVSKVVASVQSPEFQGRLKEDASLLRDVIAGKAKERVAPLVKRLAYRAVTDRDPVDVVPTVAQQHTHQHVPAAAAN